MKDEMKISFIDDSDPMKDILLRKAKSEVEAAYNVKNLKDKDYYDLIYKKLTSQFPYYKSEPSHYKYLTNVNDEENLSIVRKMRIDIWNYIISRVLNGYRNDNDLSDDIIQSISAYIILNSKIKNIYLPLEDDNNYDYFVNNTIMFSNTTITTGLLTIRDVFIPNIYKYNKLENFIVFYEIAYKDGTRTIKFNDGESSIKFNFKEHLNYSEAEWINIQRLLVLSTPESLKDILVELDYFKGIKLVKLYEYSNEVLHTLLK